VIYCPGKTNEQIIKMIHEQKKAKDNIMIIVSDLKEKIKKLEQKSEETRN